MPISINIQKPRDSKAQRPPEVSESYQPDDQQRSFPFHDPFFEKFFGHELFRDDVFNSPSGVFQSSSMSMQEDAKQVQVALDIPGVAANKMDVKVHESPSSCLVDLTGERDFGSRGKKPFRQQIEMGPLVDCGDLSARISRGVLMLSAPKKTTQTATTRTLQVKED